MKKFKGYSILILCVTIICVTLIRPMEVYSFNKTTVKKNISVTYKKLPNGVLVIYKNKNKSTVKLSATMHFRDGEKKDISKETQKNLCLRGKSSAAFFFRAPLDEYGIPINYDSYVCSYSVAKSKYKSYSNKITVTSDIQTTETQFAAVNMSGKKLTNIHATIVFYDRDNHILDSYGKYLNCFDKNSINQFAINYAGEYYQPHKVKVYIDWAY